MRFSAIFLSLFASTSLVFALPSTSTVETNDLILRHDGDVGVFQGRDITHEEIRARDLAINAASGGDLDARADTLDGDEVTELALRYVDMDELESRDLIDLELEPRAAAAIVRGVAQGIVKIVQAIKGQIEKDKGVCRLPIAGAECQADYSVLAPWRVHLHLHPQGPRFWSWMELGHMPHEAPLQVRWCPWKGLAPHPPGVQCRFRQNRWL